MFLSGTGSLNRVLVCNSVHCNAEILYCASRGVRTDRETKRRTVNQPARLRKSKRKRTKERKGRGGGREEGELRKKKGGGNNDRPIETEEERELDFSASRDRVARKSRYFHGNERASPRFDEGSRSREKLAENVRRGFR